MKEIKNYKIDGKYVILEFTDGTFLPLVTIDSLIDNNPRCKFCYTPISAKPLCTLNDIDYICLDCTTKIIETFGKNGYTINLDLSAISPKLAKKVANFMTNIDAKKVEFNVGKSIEKDLTNDVNNSDTRLVRSSEILTDSETFISKLIESEDNFYGERE